MRFLSLSLSVSWLQIENCPFSNFSPSLSIFRSLASSRLRSFPSIYWIMFRCKGEFRIHSLSWHVKYLRRHLWLWLEIKTTFGFENNYLQKFVYNAWQRRTMTTTAGNFNNAKCARKAKVKTWTTNLTITIKTTTGITDNCWTFCT